MSARGKDEIQTGIEWISNAPYIKEIIITMPLIAVAAILLILGAFLTLEPAFITRASMVAASVIILTISTSLIARGRSRPREIGFFSKGFALRSRQGRVRSFLWTDLEDVTVRSFLSVPCADVRYRDQSSVKALLCGHAAKELATRFLKRA